MGHEQRVWSFANAVLDERAFELTVDGQPVRLERKYFETLVVLVEHAGEVVTRKDLLDAVWPGRVVTEAVLNKCIWKLRDVLGDRDQSIIKTVHGVGFRLVAPLREAPVAAAASPPGGDRRAGLAILVVVALVVAGAGVLWRATGEVRELKQENSLASARAVAERLGGPPLGKDSTLDERLQWLLGIDRKTLDVCQDYRCSDASLATVKSEIARTQVRLGRFADAVLNYDEALRDGAWTDAERLDLQVRRAAALAGIGRWSAVRRSLGSLAPAQVAALEPQAPTRGRLRRVEGVLARHDGRPQDARRLLEEALEILSRTYSTQYEAEQVRAELEAEPGPVTN